MERRYYDSESLSRALELYEREFHMSSAEFFEAHCLDGETIAHVPHFHRNVWAGLYRDVIRMREGGDRLVAQIERTLEYA
jgi:hypothetical protein